MMESYIYYRILKIVSDSGKIKRSELIDKTNLHSVTPNPIDYMIANKFIKKVDDPLLRIKPTYYEITKKGIKLQLKMYEFFYDNENLLKQLHTRLKLEDNKNLNEVVLLTPK